MKQHEMGKVLTAILYFYSAPQLSLFFLCFFGRYTAHFLKTSNAKLRGAERPFEGNVIRDLIDHLKLPV